MMTTACDRLASVEDNLGNVPLMQRDLGSLVKGQEKMETTVERIEQAQRDAQTQFERQFQLQLESYEATAKKVVDLEKLYGELDKKVFAYALLAAAAGVVVGTLFTGLPAWLERHPLQKASFMMSSALVRGRG
jgi:hypothetical protein